MIAVIDYAIFDQVVQWWKNGDHPKDDIFRRFDDTGELPKESREGKIVRYYRHPHFPNNMICPHCSKKLAIHGWLDFDLNGQIVCPGDYVLCDDVGRYFALKPDAFKSLRLKASNGVQHG